MFQVDVPSGGQISVSRKSSKVLQKKTPIEASVCKRVASPEGKDEKIFPTTSEYSACFLFVFEQVVSQKLI